MQIRYIPEMFRAVVEKPSEIEAGTKGISSFKAFTISAASRVGTGNVAGVAIAISVGGPGAIFWMWMMAMIGGATAFVESTLAQVYKVRDKSSYRGGPAYYIDRALGWKWLSTLFAIMISVTYGFVFNAVQTNSIVAAVETSAGIDSMVVKIGIGLCIAALTASIIFGGVQRIANVTQAIVPIMAVLYLILAIIVIAMNISQVPVVFSSIISHAFGLREFTGATIGTVMMQGVRRGLFSNEAGMGSAPNAAATASVSHPVKQGLIQTLGVYFDTWVVCSATAFIILLANPDLHAGKEGIALTQSALSSSVGGWAIHFLTLIILFLAFSSVIGNYYYGESNIGYITKNSLKALNAYRTMVVLFVFGGAIGSIPLVWALADVFSGLLASINIIGIFPLAGVAVMLLKHFNVQRAAGLNPVLRREDLPRNIKAWDQMQTWDKDDSILERTEQYEGLDYGWKTADDSAAEASAAANPKA